jgi:DNA replication protein DnaC
MMADFEWDWPTHLHRPTAERVLSLDFLAQRENVIVVASHGLGKTMIAKNLVHQAILAGHSARFLTAADLILDLTKQETARALQHRLRTYMRPALLAVD